MDTQFQRIERLPPYVFNIIGELKQAARARGEDIIDFGMGNPDQPTPPHIVEKLRETVGRGDTHRYSQSKGIPRLRKAICDWYQNRYAVSLDPETEAIVTLGSKEGLAHLALATTGVGDAILVPNPSYPIHPYGFVISGGGGILIVEELEHALSRKAKIYAEIKGYSATSDGDDMVAPSGEGAKNCMKKSLEMSGLKSVDYLNAHGTSTPAGDPIELNAIKSVFKDNIPIVSSTKSLTGHTLGAAGVQECIYSILMMNGNFIAGNKNLTDPIPEADGINIPEKSLQKEFDSFMSNSFGFGGTNVSLVLSKFKN